VWPADKVERRPVASLTPYARNARTHSAEQIDQIAASIREWGWTIPVLVDESGGLIAGHARLLAARKLGLVDVARNGRVRLVRGPKASLCARGQ
jgi:ParB-like chromosome segregation protein Spo0J